jgi:hypothetical protein
VVTTVRRASGIATIARNTRPSRPNRIEEGNRITAEARETAATIGTSQRGKKLPGVAQIDELEVRLR